jgi:enoyl-[acyl-carrier protein] reductase I
MICNENTGQWLAGKKGLVVGLANDKSIAWGCIQAFNALGADLAITYRNEKTKTYTERLAKEVSAPIFTLCDVTVPGSLEAVFAEIKNKWGKLDFLLHAIAFAPKDDLHGRVVDCSLDGFLMAMNISCHSFIRMAKLAEPLMVDGGSLLTLTYHGSQKVVPGYNVMGPIKAALESTVRYMASELGAKGIRVNAVSSGSISTRAGNGIKDFSNVLDKDEKTSPLHRLTSQQDVGWTAAFLASDKARSITGHISYVDCGVNILR